jgi:hypothetical protein
MQLWIILFLFYIAISLYSLVQSAKPVLPCRQEEQNFSCFQPLISPGEPMTIQLALYNHSSLQTYKWAPVETCKFHFNIPESSGLLPIHLTKNETCEVEIPAFARHRSTDRNSAKVLKARFVFKLVNKDVVTTESFDLTRIKQRQERSGLAKKKAPRKLLSNDTAGATKKNTYEEPEELIWVPYLKYGKSPIRIRVVSEYREYGGYLQRTDGIKLQARNRTTYNPTIYIDDLSLPYSSEIEIGPPEANKPPVKLQIKIGSISPVMDSVNHQIHLAFSEIKKIFPEEDLDEIRYMIQDEKLYRFLLTQIISFVHMWFDYLAFRDEIGFYRGKKNMSGVSTSTVLTRFGCSIIILLYLLDGGLTSWVVMLSLFSSCAVEGWKVLRLLNPTITSNFPFVKFRQLQTPKELETAEYDRIATKMVALVLYPLVAGWSLYALKHYEYTSWYSWLISNLANAVYTFGFISLCPQLYINYRLKSVAHLPWKVFLYKIFNTFVDDAFAWLIDMPWKHRIMTLRDDVVFLLFLAQVYLYKVDKTRTNGEFSFYLRIAFYL